MADSKDQIKKIVEEAVAKVDQVIEKGDDSPQSSSSNSSDDSKNGSNDEQKENAEENKEEQAKQKCIIDCTNAKNLCIQTMSYSLMQNGKFTDPKNYKKFEDCANLCDLTANLILRQSDLMKDVAKICKESCESADKVCAEFSQDKQMQSCSKYLKACAESCNNI